MKRTAEDPHNHRAFDHQASPSKVNLVEEPSGDEPSNTSGFTATPPGSKRKGNRRVVVKPQLSNLILSTSMQSLQTPSISLSQSSSSYDGSSGITIKERESPQTKDDIELLEKTNDGKEISEINILLHPSVKEFPFSEAFLLNTLSDHLRTLDLSGGCLEKIDLVFCLSHLKSLKEIDFSNNMITEIIHSEYLLYSDRIKQLEGILPPSLKKINLSWNYLTEFPSLDLIRLFSKKGIILDIRFNSIRKLPPELMYEADDASSDTEYHDSEHSSTSEYVSMNHNILYDIRNTIPTEVLPNLFLGSMQAAKNVHLLCNTLNVKYILNVSTFQIEADVEEYRGKKYEEFFEEILNLHVLDDDKQDIVNLFPVCFDFIDKARKKNNSPILVHCMAGQSRSVSIVIGYVMKELNMDFQTAFAFVKGLHSYSQPNMNFQMQLSTYFPGEDEEKVDPPSVITTSNDNR